MKSRTAIVLFSGILLFLAAFFWRVSVGAYRIDGLVIWHWLTGTAIAETDVRILNWRTQQALLLSLVGAALAVSGAVYQASLRNMLADPFILGVSAGAALGSALAIQFFSWFPALPLNRLLPLAAFLGALLPLCFLHVVQRWKASSMLTLVLGGVAINSFLSALLTLIMYYSRNLRDIYAWLLGGARLVDTHTLVFAAVIILGSSVWLLRRASLLNLMLLDERVSASLGVEPARERLRLLTVASLAVAAAVALSGMIGFVGLLVPHAARLLIGADHRLLLPSSFFLGAAVLCFCDGIAQILIAGTVVPVGIITSFVGAPFFVLLLLRRA